jgi:hypothetical protein
MHGSDDRDLQKWLTYYKIMKAFPGLIPETIDGMGKNTIEYLVTIEDKVREEEERANKEAMRH